MWSVLNKAGRAGQKVLSVTDRYFEPAADLILRVPSLVLLDYCWQFELDQTLLWGADANEKYGIFNTIMAISLLLHAVAVLLLPLEYVVKLYMHYIAAAVLVLSNQFSYYHVSSESAQPTLPSLAGFFQLVPVWRLWDDWGYDEPAIDALHALPHVQFLRRQLAAIAVHLTAAVTVIILLEVEDTFRRVSLLAHAVPVVALMANMASGPELMALHNCAGAVTILTCLTWLLGCAPVCIAYYQQLYLKYYFHATQVYDAAGMVRHLAATVFVPRLQLVYWLCLVSTQLHHYVYVPRSHPIARQEWYIVALSAVASTTASPISLVSFCVAVAYGSRWTVRLLRALLQGGRPAGGAGGEADHSGWVEAVTVLVLALQVDLIHLRMPARLAVMSVVLFVALTGTAQAAYDVTEAAVFALSASGSRSIGRHVRVVLVCTLLVALPVYLTLLLCRLFEREVWILVVGSSALTLAVQAAGLLTVYAVFVYDALRREPWRHLDDVVYGTRALAGGAQVAVATMVVAVGAWESFSGRWSVANALVLVAHCYFNVWRRLNEGWVQFLLRRAAARTARRLPAATPDVLARYGDVCAICYCPMSEARHLPCRHLFHAACLRKWLYVQSKCPMCQKEIVTPPEQTPTSGSGDGAPDQLDGSRVGPAPSVGSERLAGAGGLSEGATGPVEGGLVDREKMGSFEQMRNSEAGESNSDSKDGDNVGTGTETGTPAHNALGGQAGCSGEDVAAVACLEESGGGDEPDSDGVAGVEGVLSGAGEGARTVVENADVGSAAGKSSPSVAGARHDQMDGDG